MNIKLMSRLSVTCIMLAFLFVSCGNNEKKQNIQKIDSLITLATDLINQIDNIQMDSVNAYYSDIIEHNVVFKNKLNGLPESLEMRNNLINYGTIEKGFKKIPNKLKEFKNELQLSEKQLNDLLSDIQNNLLSTEEFHAYFSDEKSILLKMQYEIVRIINVLDKQIQDFHKLKPVVDLFTDSLSKTEDKI
ncbi:MAG: hypothetical protein ABIJ97_15625 [Bacteroidota bacterium]